jgi:hypothetical protein
MPPRGDNSNVVRLVAGERGRVPMCTELVLRRKLALVLTTAALGSGLLATPAAAQVYFGADPWGAGVQVGPFGFGVGPEYWGYRAEPYATRATAE